MSLEETKKELREFVRTHFNVPAADPDFSDEVHLFDYGYVDSFGAVELTSFVESHFGVKITDNDLVAYPLNTVSEISGFVVKRKQEGAQ